MLRFVCFLLVSFGCIGLTMITGLRFVACLCFDTLVFIVVCYNSVPRSGL